MAFKNILIQYHGYCNDGFFAAYILNKALLGIKVNGKTGIISDQVKIECKALSHSDKFQQIENVEQYDLIIYADITPPKEILIELIEKKSCSIVVLDHHVDQAVTFHNVVPHMNGNFVGLLSSHFSGAGLS